jgi:putative FmdB family regulatory protein
VPTYDYVCSACGHRFEVVHGLNENGPGRCPLCGGSVSRAFAPPTIVFKGSGWARTDRRASSTARAKAAARAEGGAPRPEGAGQAGTAASQPTDSASAGSPATDAKPADPPAADR